MKQELTLFITLAILLVLMTVYFYIYITAHQQESFDKVKKAFYRFRSKLLIFLLIMAVPITYSSLKDFPIPSQNSKNNEALVVNVTGYQWYWEISQTEFKVNQDIEFRVTSADVTHGFGIYDIEDMRMLIQTQAMPEYVNKLPVTFEKAGTYRILCMEYCGLAHHSMVIDLTVTD